MQFSLWHSMHSTLLPRAAILIWNDGILGLFTFTDMGRGHIFIRPMQYWWTERFAQKKYTKIRPMTLFKCRKSKFTVGFHCSRHCNYVRILSALKQMLNCCQLIIVSLEQANDGCVYIVGTKCFFPYHVLLGPTTIWMKTRKADSS